MPQHLFSFAAKRQVTLNGKRKFASVRRQLQPERHARKSCGAMSNAEVNLKEFRSHSGAEAEQNLIVVHSLPRHCAQPLKDNTDTGRMSPPCMPLRVFYPSSITGKARSPSWIGKLFEVRQMMALLAIRDLPTTLRTKSRFTASLAVGTSVHFASNSSSRPPFSTTKSTSRVRSRQKNRLPIRPARRSRSRNWAKTNVSQIAPAPGA